MLFRRRLVSKRHRFGPRRLAGIRQLGEFILMYDDVRRAESPDDALYQFLESTWDAAARLGGWDREALELASAD